MTPAELSRIKQKLEQLPKQKKDEQKETHNIEISEHSTFGFHFTQAFSGAYIKGGINKKD